MAAIRCLYTCARNAVLLLAPMVCGGNAYSSATSLPTTLPTTGVLQQVIEDHYYAISENRLDEAMGYYHSQSPEIVATRESIEIGLSQYLLKTTTMSFCYVGQEGEIAIATATHKYLMITGIKFIEHVVDTVYQLREEQGSWKIWTQKGYSPNDGAIGSLNTPLCPILNNQGES
jgi:hypothetical protein